MKAIFKTGNVYVLVNGEMRDDVNKNDVEELIFDVDRDGDELVCLYGGRVILDYSNYYNGFSMKVDGISLYNLNFELNSLSWSKVVAFLNQIENLGIDSFITNYRIQLEATKQECINLAEKIEQGACVDSEKQYLLKHIYEKIEKLSFLVFACLINMNAGLENQFYIDARNTIMNLYF